MTEQRRFRLTLACVDRPGIVAAVATCVFEQGGNIMESAQFHDPETGGFFMRVVFAVTPRLTLEHFRFALDPVVKRFDMRVELKDGERRPRVLIMVSRFDHCLEDLLYRHRIGALAADITAVVSNHEVCRRTVEEHDHVFHHWPVTKEAKAEQEERLLALVDASETDLVVLARYMQVLSDTTSQRLYGRAINIHHSFLPSFKGAKPYHQAHARGVKLIGATAHYVTADLDEGPIVEQEVERVHHAMTPDDLVAAGRDIESRVLARAVNLHLEQRVLLNGAKTVVFT